MRSYNVTFLHFQNFQNNVIFVYCPEKKIQSNANSMESRKYTSIHLFIYLMVKINRSIDSTFPVIHI